MPSIRCAALAMRTARGGGGRPMTKRRFKVTYRDEHDKHNRHSTIMTGPDEEFVETKFYDRESSDGWVIESIEEVDAEGRPKRRSR